MNVRSGQLIEVLFQTFDVSTSENANGSSVTAVLKLNGTTNGAAVTITNQTTGQYKASVTLPALAIGDAVEIVVTATVSAKTGSKSVWRGNCNLALDSSGHVTVGTLASAAILSIWSALTSALTTIGSIGKLLVDRIDAAISSRSTYAGADTAGTTTLLARLTPTRAGYLDNLSGGQIATQNDIIAINQSASRRLLLTTVMQYEIPETGTRKYTVELRTYDGDGAVLNATGNPNLTATGKTANTNLTGNLSAITSPATGLYRWDYTVSTVAVQEEVRFDVSANLGDGTFTLSCYTQVCDMVAITFADVDRNRIIAIFDKLPANGIADQTSLSAAIDAVPTAAENRQEMDANSTQLAAIVADTNEMQTDLVNGGRLDNLLDAIPSATNTVLTTAHGSGSWVGGGGGGGGTGNGARTIVVTVDDGTDPVQSAKVRFTKGVETYISSTDSDGEVTFNIDDGVWLVSITRGGYQFSGDSITVSGDAAATYSMDAVAMVPSIPGRTTGFLVAYGLNGAPVSGKLLRAKLIEIGASQGGAFDGRTIDVVSDGSGLVQFPNLLLGAKYEIRGGASGHLPISIPASAPDPFELPSLVV